MSDQTRPVAIMCFSDGTGGMERSALRLAGFLSTITRVVLVCKKGSFLEDLYNKETASYLCVPIPFLSRIFSPSMLFQARSVISKYDIGNVIFFGASELKTLYFSFIGKEINLIVWHGTTKSRPKRDFFHKLVYSSVRYHVALSNHLLRNVKTIVPETIGAVYKVICPSFDFGIKLSGVNRSEEVSIVHVGRIAKGKGQVDAVLACKLLKDRGIKFKLVLIGSADNSDYYNELKAAVRDNGLESLVEIANYVDNVNNYLEKADVFLFPSAGEGMPNAFIEALHYDIICIAYKNTVFHEFIEMGFHVHLVADSDVEELSIRLLDVVMNLDDERMHSANNPVLARNYFQVDREVKGWLEILI